MKTCLKCKLDKPETCFGKRVASPVSTKKYSQSWCSECRKEAVYKGRGKIPLPVVDWSRRQLPPRQFEVTLPVDPKDVEAAFAPPPIPTDRNELKALYHRLY